MTLRPAALADVPQITRIYAHHVQTGSASFELDPPDEGQMRERFAAIAGAAYPYWAAVDADDRVLGYAYANAYRTRPAYRFTVEDSIYVAPEATGHGVGRALLLRLIDECAARGFRQMIAVIGDSNNRPSIALHQSCGFRQAALLRSIGFKFGRWVDIVLMQRPLGDGDTTLVS